MKVDEKFLKSKIIEKTHYIPHSRIHELKTFNTSSAKSYVKRDDELGFGISGSKLRKYISLIPYLISKKTQEAVLIGGAHSNHVLGLTQLLIENRIKPTLFLLGHPGLKQQGNLLLLSMLISASQIHWVARKDWADVEVLASHYIRQKETSTVLIPEGGCMEQALPGALTLTLDILRNEEEHQCPFQHIFMDAGTGLSAIATILTFACLKKRAVLHILLLAGDEQEFITRLKQFHQSFERFLEVQVAWSDILEQFKLHRPTMASSFGSVNATVIEHICSFAREEGFFTDPIYSAKLFWEAKQILRSEALEGNVLIIHSGGALTLMGFQKELEKHTNF